MIKLQGGGKCDSIQMCDHRCVDTQPELCTAQNVTEVEREEMEVPGTRTGVNPWKVIQSQELPGHNKLDISYFKVLANICRQCVQQLLG